MTSRWWFYPALGVLALPLLPILLLVLAAILTYPTLPTLETLTTIVQDALRVFSAEAYSSVNSAKSGANWSRSKKCRN